MRIRLGCLSEDRRYMMRLTNFFMARYPGQIEASVFTRQQELLSFFEDGGRMDVLLAQPDMLTSPQSLPGRVILAYLVEEPDVTGWNGRPAVCKYQKAQQLFRAVQGLAAEQDAQGRQYGRQRQAQMVLFMGAAGGVGCTTAAIGFAARMAAQGRKTLFLSLQQNSLSDRMLQSGNSMTQVLYELKSRMSSGQSSNFALKLESLLTCDPVTRVYSYAPFQLPVDAMSLGEEELRMLLQTAAQLAEYCVLDMDGVLSPLLLEALRQSDRAVLVADGSVGGNEKLDRMLRSLQVLNDSDDPVVRGELGVLYSCFGSGCRVASDLRGAQMIGTIPRYTGAAPSRIVQELIGSDAFAPLES